MALETIGICVALITIVLVAAYRYFSSTFGYFEKLGISGPKPGLIFGNWWGLWNKFIGNEDLANIKEYGKVFGIFNGRTPCLMVADPDFVKFILLEKPGSFKSHRASTVKSEHLKNSLLALEGNEGSEISVAFSQDKIKKLVPRILQATEAMRKKVKEISGAEEANIDISSLASEFLSNCLAGTLFGLDSSSNDLQQFSANLSCAFLNDNPDSPMAVLPFLYPAWTPIDKFVLRNKANKFFTMLCILNIEEKLKLEKLDEDRLPDLIDLLVEVLRDQKRQDKEEKEDSPTNEILLAQTLAVLLNASLLTKSLVSLSVSTLASKPEIQDKVHSDLTKNLLTSAEISFDLVQNSEYLDMFVAEVLRIYPLEFRLDRECRETVEYEELKIEKGTIVSVPIYALHHLDEYYPEPETFNPERFSPDNLQKRKMVTYLPYGQAGGKGANLSVQISMLIAKLAIATMIKNFKFMPSEETKIPPEFYKGITGVVRPKPITVAVQARK